MFFTFHASWNGGNCVILYTILCIVEKTWVPLTTMSSHHNVVLSFMISNFYYVFYFFNALSQSSSCFSHSAFLKICFDLKLTSWSKWKCSIDRSSSISLHILTTYVNATREDIKHYILERERVLKKNNPILTLGEATEQARMSYYCAVLLALAPLGQWLKPRTIVLLMDNLSRCRQTYSYLVYPWITHPTPPFLAQTPFPPIK